MYCFSFNALRVIGILIGFFGLSLLEMLDIRIGVLYSGLRKGKNKS